MKTPLRLLAAFFCLAHVSAYAQPARAPAGEPDVLLQGFHWNAHPGDHSQNANGLWWDSLRVVAPALADAGFETVWIPSPAKGQGGRFSMGYDLYDYYDLGDVEQKGTRRTRFGTDRELEQMLAEFQRVGLRTMADVVLNHRDGGDARSDVACVPGGGAPFRKFNVFTPGSRRFPATAASFHANATHCDFDGPYHSDIFGQDVCYFDGTDLALDAAAPNGGWYRGPHSLGHVGDSLIVWGRWLLDEVGIDEVRIDAVKHIEPGFLAPWLVELSQGGQPFAVGEFFGGTSEIIDYHTDVERFNTTFGSGNADAALSLFDFGLRYALKDMADGGGFFDMRSLNGAGLHFSGLDAESAVTFVENHDFDRIGWAAASCGTAGAVPYGNTCVRLTQDVGHAPVLSRKHLGYAYLMAAEGRPTVWWKDYFWHGLDDEIRWLMNLRRWTAQGESAPMSALRPNAEIDQADFWALSRQGLGNPRYGMVLAINDSEAGEETGYVDTPHASYELRDYSDSYLFETTQAFADGRMFVKARPGNYAWFAPTGLYPRPPDEPASAFTLEAEPGGKLHFVVLRAADAAQLLVNGAPIQPGDEVAVLGPTGSGAAGLGRVGQRLRWDGEHDLLIEVLGNDDGTNAKGRLKAGDPLRLVVSDQSAGVTVEAGSIAWAASGSAFAFHPDRPASRGGALEATVTDADGAFSVSGLSRVAGFSAGGSAVALALTPLGAPVTVLGSGGQLSFEIDVQNLTGTPQSFEVWTDVLLPNGNVFGPVITARPVTLPAGGAGGRTVRQSVPGAAPAGAYVYRAYAGTYPDVVIASDSFPFTKSGAARPESPVAVGWDAADRATGDAPSFGVAEPVASAATQDFRFEPAYPNPFGASATLRFAVPTAQPVRVELYDGLGRRVRVLYDGTPAAGSHAVALDGRGLPSGVYLVRLVGEGVSATQTLVRMR